MGVRVPQRPPRLTTDGETQIQHSFHDTAALEQLFRDTFSASDGSAAGALIGALAHVLAHPLACDLATTTPFLAPARCALALDDAVVW